MFSAGNTFSYYMIGLAGLFIGLGEIVGKMVHVCYLGSMLLTAPSPPASSLYILTL